MSKLDSVQVFIMRFYSQLLTFIFAAVIASSFGSLQAHAQSREPITPDDDVVSKHLVGEVPVIRMDFSKFPDFPGATAMPVELTVDEQGNVLTADLDDDEDADDTKELTKAQLKIVKAIVAEAKKIGMQLHFRPFEEEGHPVPAQFQLLIPVRSLEVTKHIPFPQIHNWNSLKITLSRTGCFGMCPSYSVEVHGDGSVLYEGGSYVAVKGSHRGTVSGDAVLQMVEAFRAADYFSLKNSYMLPATDLPTYKTSVSVDGKTKEVVDYAGGEVGMPESVSKLEETIDRLSGVERWTKGNSETVPALMQEKFDFKSAEASQILANVARMGNADAVRDLVAAGVVVASTEPTQTRFGAGGTALGNAAGRGDVEMLRVLLGATKDPDAKTDALEQAAFAGKIDAVRLLIQYGANAAASDVLVGAASSGIPTVVQEILKYKPDVNTRSASGTTALLACLQRHHYKDTAVNLREVVRLLLDAGADPNIADKEGQTPLIANAWDVEIARMLVAHGANVNAQGKDGFTPLLNAGTLELMRFLLEHGANPFAKTERGETALDLAKQNNHKDMVALLEAAMSGKRIEK